MAGESAAESARRLRERALRLERAAGHYEQGAAGEQATAAALTSLPSDEWAVFHDVRWPGRQFANVDHVVVGPPGVFVVDSKNWTGRVEVRDGTLRQNGRKREAAVAGVAGAASAVSGLTQFLPPQQVVPVLCFARDDAITGRAHDVMVCSTANVVEMLTTRQSCLNPAEREQICADLDASLHPAVAAAPGPARQRARAWTSRVDSAAAAGKATSAARKLALRVIGVLVVAGAVVGFVSSDLPQDFGKFFVSIIESDRSKPPAPGKHDEGREKSDHRNRQN